MRLIRPIGVAIVLLALAACALDREDALRDTLGRWMELAETRHFTSNGSCTVALFKLGAPALTEDAPLPTASLDTALAQISADQAVLFDMPGKSPNDISQDVMTRDLARGIGLISSGIGPTRACMEDWVMRGAYAMLTSPETQMIYAPSMDALVLIYLPEDYVLFLRGAV